MIGLSIDWDFFFSKATGPIYQSNFHSTLAWNAAKPTRMVIEPYRLIDHLRKCNPAGWTKLIVCDNHAHAFRVFRGFDSVVNFDFHADRKIVAGFENRVSCGSWAKQLAQRGTSVRWIKPSSSHWPTIHPSVVMLCRSSPWVHPKHDQRFLSFFRTVRGLCPRASVSKLDSITPRKNLRLSPEETLTKLSRIDFIQTVWEHTFPLGD